MEDFVKIYNDIKRYPTLAKVAEKLNIHTRTVSKKALRARELGYKLNSRKASYKKDIVDKHNSTVQSYRVPKKRNTKNARVFVISDMHVPYHHPDTIAFFKAVKKKYNPDRVICIGDELDNHAMSYHETDPDNMNAGDELRKSRPIIKEIEKIFPEMDLVESNHGSLYFRKARSAGIPREVMLPYNELLQVGDGWRWHFDLTIEMSNGAHCYFHHGKTSDALTLSRNMGMSSCQGHYHSRFKADYWSNSNGLYFGLQVGCMIDDDALAFAYNKTTLERPIIGCAIILDGVPKMLPLIKEKGGRWDGTLA
ncbi:MAG: metallophosphoesterase [Gammaproteobacteria bacterium]|nr:metallophosphoesterase [Gammaproteobacteria bacterium]